MEIYILRHGIAEDQADSGRDEDRALTSEGKKKLLMTLALAHHAKVKPDLVLTSPYKRALETAEIASEVLHLDGEKVSTNSLTPDGDPAAVWQELRTHKDAPSVLLSSHNPLVSRLTGYLLGVPNMAVDFKKGAIVRIDVDSFGPQPRGWLKWMITAKLSA